MKAVIVAAGKSSRLYPLTLDMPKPLLEINGKSIIEHSIDALNSAGVSEIAVVVGYRKEKIVEKLGEKISYIENTEYESNNNLASLGYAKEFVGSSGFIYLHSDLVYDPKILNELMEVQGGIVLSVDKKQCDKEDMKVRVENNRFIESSKEIPLNQAYGEWIGMIKFSIEGAALMFNEIENVVKEGKKQSYDTVALNQLAQKGENIEIVETKGLYWQEIDFKEEFDAAKKYLEKDGVINANDQ